MVMLSLCSMISVMTSPRCPLTSQVPGHHCTTCAWGFVHPSRHRWQGRPRKRMRTEREREREMEGGGDKGRRERGGDTISSCVNDERARGVVTVAASILHV